MTSLGLTVATRLHKSRLRPPYCCRCERDCDISDYGATQADEFRGRRDHTLQGEQRRNTRGAVPVAVVHHGRARSFCLQTALHTVRSQGGKGRGLFIITEGQCDVMVPDLKSLQRTERAAGGAGGESDGARAHTV